MLGNRLLKTVLKSLSSRCRSILIRIKKSRLVRWHNVFAESQSPYDWPQFLGCFIEDVLNAGNNRPFIHSQKVLSYLQQVNNWGEMELRLISILPLHWTQNRWIYY